MSANAEHLAELALHTEVQHHPSALRTAAHGINEQHRAAEDSWRVGARNALSHAIEAGRKLIYAKSLVPHGEWLPWLRDNIEFSERRAQAYMQLAANPGLANAPIPADLGIERALKQIAASASSDNESSDDDSNTHNGSRSESISISRIVTRLLNSIERLFGESSKVNRDDLVGRLADGLRSGYEDPSAWAKDMENLWSDVCAVLELSERSRGSSGESESDERESDFELSEDDIEHDSDYEPDESEPDDEPASQDPPLRQRTWAERYFESRGLVPGVKVDR